MVTVSEIVVRTPLVEKEKKRTPVEINDLFYNLQKE